jgi:hypothetical protein
MQAIEFIAKIKDGIIKIPKKHLKDIHNECRIIILMETAKSHKELSPKKKRTFSSLEIKTKDLHFDRDEANER